MLEGLLFSNSFAATAIIIPEVFLLKCISQYMPSCLFNKWSNSPWAPSYLTESYCKRYDTTSFSVTMLSGSHIWCRIQKTCWLFFFTLWSLSWFFFLSFLNTFFFFFPLSSATPCSYWFFCIWDILRMLGICSLSMLLTSNLKQLMC